MNNNFRSSNNGNDRNSDRQYNMSMQNQRSNTPNDAGQYADRQNRPTQRPISQNGRGVNTPPNQRGANPNYGAPPRANQNYQSGQMGKSGQMGSQPTAPRNNYQKAPQKKVKLTKEQIEINRANLRREKYRRKKQRAAALRVFVSRFLLFIVIFALMSGITAALFFLNLTKRDSTDVSGYRYTIGDDKEYTLRYSDAVREGRVYISFTDIAEFCDLATLGSATDMKFVIKSDEEETIRFVTGTRAVYVNNVETRLSSESFVRDGSLFVPLDFVSAYFKGLDVKLDSKAHRVSVTRAITNGDANGELPRGEEPIYSELSFLLASPAPMEGIDEEIAKELIPMPDMGFIVNLTPYEEYMNPGNTTDYLTLVNTDHPLDATYTPQDMIPVINTRDDGREKEIMRLYAAKALEAFFKEMEAAGFTSVSVTSGYRSYSYQDFLFNLTVQEYSYLGADEAYAKAKTIRQPAGCSEHQTGLTVDMHNLPGADISFANCEEYRWMRDNCWKFGFILRYPENKTDITGVSYEPWHYRFVGRYHAQRIFNLGMCLEEYCEYLGLN